MDRMEIDYLYNEVFEVYIYFIPYHDKFLCIWKDPYETDFRKITQEEKDEMVAKMNALQEMEGGN